MKVVLDTNIILVILPSKSKYRWIFDELIKGNFSIAVTNDILEEYTEVIEQFYSAQLSEDTIKLLLNLKNVELITPYYKWNLIKSDEDDNKFVDCALMAGADYIITHDKHYKDLDEIEFPKIDHIKIEKFEILLKENEF